MAPNSSPSTPGRVPQSNGGVPQSSSVPQSNGGAPNNQTPKQQDQVQRAADPAVQESIMHYPEARSALSAKELEAELGVAVSPVRKTDVHVVNAKTPCPAGERSIEEPVVQSDAENDCDPKF
ncbi:hypothetical protein PHYSODRAFT_298194 [Phytophthora sojae]|uniref:Uncharacterized protein n=1 Tax=Phytophthora sojae (strain P6497) TaxID=1094619 RepID=G4Z9T0_PHYSP|nr:hypothetical protein PHYSODRAFT_298194 [Phytophthora sojae]EGZ19783.1 hypothetical protein PHYSODRAFT_298194 [Phytophthora sojae]|eukprot:XP_009522500.1 hypothetical protein PHYSODRAFT_298194 [Phytophthora sojae]